MRRDVENVYSQPNNPIILLHLEKKLPPFFILRSPRDIKACYLFKSNEWKENEEGESHKWRTVESNEISTENQPQAMDWSPWSAMCDSMRGDRSLYMLK